MNKFGYTKFTKEFDERGNVINQSYYDIDGNEIAAYPVANYVFPGSNSEKFGIQNGDYFILYDGQPVKDYLSFIEMRSKETGGLSHELIVLRNNEFVAIQIYPGKLGCELKSKAPSADQQNLISEKLKEAKKTE